MDHIFLRVYSRIKLLLAIKLRYTLCVRSKDFPKPPQHAETKCSGSYRLLPLHATSPQLRECTINHQQVNYNKKEIQKVNPC